jgi:hypothetical protein
MEKAKKPVPPWPMLAFAVNIARLGVAIYFAIVHPFGPFDDPS